MAQRTPEPTELIYLPQPSWAPVLIAVGLAIVLAGAVVAWFWSVIGAAILLGGVRAWWRTSDEEISRMRREQTVETAVIPAQPIRSPQSGS